jgi:hypothetical protein
VLIVLLPAFVFYFSVPQLHFLWKHTETGVKGWFLSLNIREVTGDFFVEKK